MDVGVSRATAEFVSPPGQVIDSFFLKYIQYSPYLMSDLSPESHQIAAHKTDL